MMAVPLYQQSAAIPWPMMVELLTTHLENLTIATLTPGKQRFTPCIMHTALPQVHTQHNCRSFVTVAGCAYHKLVLLIEGHEGLRSVDVLAPVKGPTLPLLLGCKGLDNLLADIDRQGPGGGSCPPGLPAPALTGAVIWNVGGTRLTSCSKTATGKTFVLQGVRMTCVQTLTRRRFEGDPA